MIKDAYIHCITWQCNSVHVLIELTFKTAFYAESAVIYFTFDSRYYGDPILH